MSAPTWKVVGGEDKGGILIREGQATTSAQCPERLSYGAMVEEIQLVKERLQFKKLSGTGPETGWASIKVSGKDLLVRQSGGPQEPAPTGVGAPNVTRNAAKAGPTSEAARPPAKDGFFVWQEEFRETYGHIFDSCTPPMPDALSWTKPELEMFYESSGQIKPVRSRGTAKAPASSPVPKVTAASAAKASKAPQIPVAEALKLQEALKKAFGAEDFQRKLKSLQTKFPKHKVRDSPDVMLFFEQFEPLVLSVYGQILPTWGLSGDFDGVGDLSARLVTAMATSRVKKLQEEINTLMGLPRDADFKPTKKKVEVLVYRPNRDGNCMDEPPVPLAVDEDGDAAHEFLAEDLATGKLSNSGPRPPALISGTKVSGGRRPGANGPFPGAGVR